MIPTSYCDSFDYIHRRKNYPDRYLQHNIYNEDSVVENGTGKKSSAHLIWSNSE